MIILQDKNSKDAALLFDDWPNPYVTARLLGVLQNKGVPGNFFLIDMGTEQSPEIVRQIGNAGHEIGNHTYTYKRLPQLLEEYGKQAEIVESYYGDNIMMYSLAVSDWEEDHNWNEEYKEALTQQAERIASEWRQITENGTLLGFHDSSKHNLPGNKLFAMWQNRALPTLEAVTQIVDFLIAEGFSIKRLSDMELD